MKFIRLLTIIISVAALSGAATGQTMAPREGEKPKPVRAAEAPPDGGPFVRGGSAGAIPAKREIPDDFQLAMLIRGTLIALNQANRTGNYSVLRDLGSPAFQQANTPFELGQAFAGLRDRKIDLDPVLLIDPKVLQPFINDRGMLRIKGYFPSKPERVDFELAFELVEGQWKIFGLAAYTTPAQAAPDPAP